jgi:hypothetical protein
MLQRLIELTERLAIERLVQLRRQLDLARRRQGGASAIVLSLFG